VPETFLLGRVNGLCYFVIMFKPADARRRWWGTFFLTMAAGFLIWGQTLLKPYLNGVGFLCYWFLCFVFTVIAMFIALLDMRAVRRHLHQQHREIVERAISEAQKASGEKSHQSKRPAERLKE
jgi:hypothetical protein